MIPKQELHPYADKTLGIRERRIIARPFFFFCEIVVTARVNLGRLIPVFSHIIARLTFVLSRLTLVMLRRKFVFVRLQNGSDTE